MWAHMSQTEEDRENQIKKPMKRQKNITRMFEHCSTTNALIVKFYSLNGHTDRIQSGVQNVLLHV